MLSLDDIKDGETNRGLLARIVGSERVWRLIQNFDVIRGQVLRRLEDQASADGKTPLRRITPTPHPAIEDFLLSLSRA